VTFTVPPSAGGDHVVDAKGTTTTAATISDVSFSVLPSVSLNQTTGAIGGTVTVTGSVCANESGIINLLG